ncbi:hypothetical protein [Streptomyces sp. NPDC059861]|uniref:hypothetical protein n=1 Tax=Streptomyces sp. NPDC059861 TaxID=3346974 RepID=UPI00364DE836
MASSATSEPTPATAAANSLQAELERLRTENRQPRQALVSYTLAGQAIGVLTALGQRRARSTAVHNALAGHPKCPRTAA